MKSKLNFNLTSEFMKIVADKEKQLIRNDASQGISQMQNGNKFGYYRSNSYKRYKANYMNRFTDKTGAKGTKLKRYTGQSVKNNNIAFVDETLTGAMLRDMQTLNARTNEVSVSFAPKDRGKVLGARRLGRELVGLNEKNQEITKELIISELNKEIENFCKEDIVIQVAI